MGAARVDTGGVSRGVTTATRRRGGRRVLSAGRAGGRTGAAAARGGTAAARAGVRRLRRSMRRGGAQESGLATLVELCSLNAASDALVAVALAGTVFFNVPVGQARGRVALYLLVTMAPFALLAPVIGPALDRLHGRRVALALSMVVRAGLCWVLAGHHAGLDLYPLALGVLVTGRGFAIARAAVTPRVLPGGMTLLSANSRVSLVGALGAGVVAPIGLGLSAVVGIGWVLRLAAVLFLICLFPCSQLPAHVDSAVGEDAARGLALGALGARTGRGLRAALGSLPTALRAVVFLRGLVGFLTLFLAFKLRTGGSGKGSLALLAAAALAGQAAGITLGNRLGRRRPEPLIAFGLVLATAVCVAGAVVYSMATGLLVALVATLSASLGKLGLDAIIQRDVTESVRNSAFARSETVLQLAWVAGGAIGLAPVTGTVGFSLAAAFMVFGLVTELQAFRIARAGRPSGRPGARRVPPRVPDDRGGAVDRPPERHGAQVPEVLLRRQAAARAEQAPTVSTAPIPPPVPTGQTLLLPFPEEPEQPAGQ